MPIMTASSDHSDRNDHDELGLFKDEATRHGGCSRMTVLLSLVVGTIATLTLTNLAASFAAVRSSKEVVVSDSGMLVSASNSNMDISTLGTGVTFQLPVVMDQQDEPYPYSCVGIEGAIDLWRSTMHGIHTNVVLQMGGDQKQQQDSSAPGSNDSSAAVELGVTLTFQGATKNGTHACLATMDYQQDQKLCIDFVSNRCESSYKDNKNQETLDEESIFRHNDRDRRALFEHIMKKNHDDRRHRPASAVRGISGRRMQEEAEEDWVCTNFGEMGCFYSDIISIVFIGA